MGNARTYAFGGVFVNELCRVAIDSWVSSGSVAALNPMNPGASLRWRHKPMRRRLTLFACWLALTATALIPEYAHSAEKVIRIGTVSPGSASTTGYAEAAFWKRLRELGWVEGRNIVAVKRYAEGDLDRLAGLIREVVEREVDVIVTAGAQSAITARNATGSIPIVALTGDPVSSGLADSLARPGGNLTGISAQNTEELPSKWVELLREMVPHLSTLAIVVNPDNPLAKGVIGQVTRATTALRLKSLILEATTLDGYDQAIAHAATRAEAVIVAQDSVAVHGRRRIAAQAQKYRIPSLFGIRQFVEVGGLMSYGADETMIFRRIAEYVDKILRGAKPADLPIEQPTQFQLVVNLKTAKALGLRIPESVLLRVDEIIR